MESLVNDISGLVNDIPAGDGKIDNLFLQWDIRKDGQKRVSVTHAAVQKNVILFYCVIWFLSWMYCVFLFNFWGQS